MTLATNRPAHLCLEKGFFDFSPFLEGNLCKLVSVSEYHCLSNGIRPALDLTLKVAAEYILEREYLAIDEHGLYVALPDTREIQICLTSQGGVCVMNQALHPIESINWCICAVFIQDQERIKKICTLNFKPREGNLARSLGGYLWAVSSLVGEKMQIRCLHETHIELIKPPLQVITPYLKQLK